MPSGSVHARPHTYASISAAQHTHGLTKLNWTHLAGAALSLLAMTYLLDVAGAQDRLIAFLGERSLSFQPGTESVAGIAIASAPFTLGLLLLLLISRMLYPGSARSRTSR